MDNCGGNILRWTQPEPGLDYEIFLGSTLCGAGERDAGSRTSTRTPGTNTWTVVAVDAAGNRSAPSNPATVTVAADVDALLIASGAARSVVVVEAATPLRQPRVHVLMGRVIVDNVVVDDPATASFLDRRIEAGDDADGGRRRRHRDRRARAGARAERGRRRVRPQRVREGLARGRDRVHRQGAGRRRVLRHQGRRGLRGRERAPGQGARAAVRRGLDAPPCSISCGR